MVATCMLRSSTSISESVSICPLRTSPGESTLIRTVRIPSLSILKGICFRFRMMSVASSTTPGMGLNSWATPSIRTAVMAAPSIELISTRRKPVPMVDPNPRSKGWAVNIPYRSVSVSVLATNRFGFWNPLNIDDGLLLRIQFDDQLLIQLDLDEILALGRLEHSRLQGFAVHFQPVGAGSVSRGIACMQSGGAILAIFAALAHVIGFHREGRDVHTAAVHIDVPMANQLAPLRAGSAETHPVNDVIQTPFEHAEHVLAGNALHGTGFLEKITELVFEQLIVTPGLLFLPELKTVSDDLRFAGLPVLAGREIALLNGALFRVAAFALQKQLHPLAPALPADGTNISCQIEPPCTSSSAQHIALCAFNQSRCSLRQASPSSCLRTKNQTLSYTRRFLGGRHPLWGIGVRSRMERTSRPAVDSARTADSRPAPGPLTFTFTLRTPDSLALLAAVSEACCAAKGVPLRDPRNPRDPELDQDSTFPTVSVIVMMVLLKDACTCTMPAGTFFFSFFLKDFFFPALAAAFAMCDSILTRSSRSPSSYWPRCRAAVLCGYGRWCASAGRAPAGHGDGATRDTNPFRSGA